MLQAEHDAQHIGLERVGIGFDRRLGQRTGLAFGAGIVDGDIEPAEAGHGLVDQGADIRLVADIGPDELGLGAELAQLLGQRQTGRLAPRGDDELRAVLGESQGSGAADTGQGAGDQDNGFGHGGHSERDRRHQGSAVES